ncbi:unnamed protein product [Parnassius apollo]|uniref:(apollo) hypothetical protein n=1 Tax=Parnassius apollo TaxID=110799 RepID=A0A8S3W6F6_PARAO|nr:unnamed protein product [Parnassius apollo]
MFVPLAVILIRKGVYEMSSLLFNLYKRVMHVMQCKLVTKQKGASQNTVEVSTWMRADTRVRVAFTVVQNAFQDLTKLLVPARYDSSPALAGPYVLMDTTRIAALIRSATYHVGRASDRVRINVPRVLLAGG